MGLAAQTESTAAARSVVANIVGRLRAASLRAIVFTGPGSPALLHEILRDGAGLEVEGGTEFSPRQADLLVIAGRVGIKSLPVIQRIWQQMPEPKWSLAVAAADVDTYALVPDPSKFLPIDVAAGGSRDEILDGVARVRRLIASSAIAKRDA